MTTTDAAPEVGPEDRRRDRAPSQRNQQLAALCIAAASAVVAAAAGCHPTGTPVVDPLLTGGYAAVITMLAGRARRWPGMVPVVVAVLASRGWALVFAIGSGITAMVGASRERRLRSWGAATGALAVQALLRLPDLGFHGASALVAGLAVVPVVVSGYQGLRPAERRQLRRVVLWGLGAAVVITAAYAFALVTARTDLERGVDESRSALDATREGRTDDARLAFERAGESFDRADTFLNGWWTAPARVVPVLAQHVRAVGTASSQGLQLSRTAEETVERANYQELRYEDGQLDLERIRSIQAPLDRTVASMREARDEVAEVDSPWLIGPASEALGDLDGELDGATDEAELAALGVSLAPEMLGGEGTRRYFVAFVTPVELRGSGGFIGSYGELEATDGKLRLVRTGSATELERAVPDGTVQITGPPDYLARYGRYEPGDYFRDMTFSPHFPYDGQVIAEAYPQAGGNEVDGVISIDPIALASLLRLTGPIRVEGFDRTLTARNAVKFLLQDNYELFPDNAQQTAALTELTEATFDRLTSGDLPAPRALARALGRPTREGRIRAWATRGPEQELFTRLGASGAFPEPRDDHDFLTIASQNSGNNKLDLYTGRAIDYDVRLGGGGRVEATATITVTNGAPPDLPPYVLGVRSDVPRGTNRMQMSVYTPHTLVSATVDGEEVGMESQSEAGYRVYSRTISVAPGESVVMVLDLEGTLDRDGDYVLDLAPQPTVWGDALTLTVGDGSGERRERDQVNLLGKRRIVVPAAEV
jgi:hypothetical protein